LEYHPTARRGLRRPTQYPALRKSKGRAQISGQAAPGTHRTVRLPVLLIGMLFGVAFSATPVFALFGSKAVPIPDWVSVAAHPEYPSPRYVLGVGLAKATKDQATDRLAADQNAFVEIIRQISADVSSAMTIEAMEVQNGRVNSYWERASAGSKVRSSLSVNGLTVVARHYDPKAKLYYSLGVLDRRVAADPYLRQLEQLKSEYLSHRATAARFESQGQAFQTIFSLRDAYRAACRYQDVLPPLQLVTGPARQELGIVPDPEAPSVQDPLDRLSAILAGIRLQIESGGGQAFVHNRPVSAPLSVKLTTGGDRLVSAEGVSVEFRFQSGAGSLLPMTKATDSLGKSSTLVQKVNHPAGETCAISASIYFRDLLDNSAYAGPWNSRIPATPTTVIFELPKKMAPPGTEVLTVVANKSNLPGNPAATQSLLAAQLAKAGFMPASNTEPERINSKATPEEVLAQLSPNVNILVFAEITADSVNDAMGMRVCNLSGSLKAFRKSDAKPLATLSFDRIRGFGVQDTQAREDAYKKAGEALATQLIEELLASYE